MNELSNAELCEAMGLHQAGVGDEGEALPRLGVLDLVEENGRDQHRIHLMRRCFAQDHRFQLPQAIQG